MAEYRTIRMSFWADPFVEELEAGAKLLYLYLFTGSHTNNLGIVEVTRRKTAFETGLTPVEVETHLQTLTNAGKIVCDGGQILLCNFIRNQTTTSPKIVQSLRRMLPSVQSVKFREALSIRYPMLFSGDGDQNIPYKYGIDTVPIPYAQDSDTVDIPSPEMEREREMEREEKENTASAPLAAELSLAAGAGNKTPEPRYSAKSGRILTGKRLDSFNRFWACFALQKGKADTADAWLDIPQLTDTLVEYICYAAECEARDRQALGIKGLAPKWASGWLELRRWEDYPSPDAQQRASQEHTDTQPYERELSDAEKDRATETRLRLQRERDEKRGLVPMARGAA